MKKNLENIENKGQREKKTDKKRGNKKQLAFADMGNIL